MNPELIAYIFGPTVFDDQEGSVDMVSQITEMDIVEKIKTGELRGLSPEIKIKWFQCGICKENYEENCMHKEGQIYDGQKCFLYPRDIEFLALSIVEKPREPKARINDMLLVDKQNKPIRYTWYGFETDKENRRFKHIQKAVNSGFIPEKIGLKFSTYFLSTYLGIVSS